MLAPLGGGVNDLLNGSYTPRRGFQSAIIAWRWKSEYLAGGVARPLHLGNDAPANRSWLAYRYHISRPNRSL